ncbi:MAG: GntR family transcriptional regulator [Bryobacteraceae bacterium]
MAVKVLDRGRRRAAQPPPPLTEQAYRAIKREILGNHLPPGTPLPVERFLREMKLSRTPVREAILRLESEGLVEIRPRLGTFVAHLDLRKIREMYHVRGVLEASAARLAATIAAPPLLAQVERELRSQNTAKGADLPAISEAGQSLHRLIVDQCGNEVLAETIRSLQDHFVRFRHISLQLPEKVLSSHREHIEILEALRRADGETAERLVREHFEHAARSLMESLLGRPESGGSLRITLPAAI